MKTDYSIFKYYKGEESCPFDRDKDTAKYNFWHGEKQFSKTQDLMNWENNAKRTLLELKEANKTDLLNNAKKYGLKQFGIILYIEELHRKWNPYDNMEWIFDY